MDAKIIGTVELETGNLGYIDFRVDGIDGVFRAANSYGIDFESVLSQISLNREFYSHVTASGVSKIFEESVTTNQHWGGWNWQETRHFKLHADFLLGSCKSWYTCPFGVNLPEVRPMSALYDVQQNGLRLLHSWNRERQPSFVCYFFPTV